MDGAALDQAISAEAFDQRCAAFNLTGRLALAISGGRDSMALAVLCAARRKRRGGGLIAFTVDHGLRDQSAREAAQVAHWCKALGIEHHTLCWDGAKPTKGLQEAARAARYRRLAEASLRAGARALLTAHSADDQAETIYMRLLRGSGPVGLGGMAEEIHIAAAAEAPIRLIRPLLPFSRAALTATCRKTGQAFIDDPSNKDPIFERVRVRALLSSPGADAPTPESLNRLGGRMRAAAQTLASAEDAAFQTFNGCFHRWGGATLDADRLFAAPSRALAGLARRLIHAVSGALHPPDEDRAIAAFERALADGRATLGGALMMRRGADLWLMREPAALLGRNGEQAIAPMPINACAKILWDSRFIVQASKKPMEIRSLGDIEASSRPPPAAHLPREAIAAQPGLFQNGALIATPMSLFVKDLSGAGFRPLAQERFADRVIRF